MSALKVKCIWDLTEQKGEVFVYESGQVKNIYQSPTSVNDRGEFKIWAKKLAEELQI